MTRIGTGRRTAIAIAAGAALLALVAASAASAAALKSGDLVVSDKRFGAVTDGQGAIFLVNPGSGAQSILAQGGSFAEPEDVRIAADGSLLVADKGENGQGAGSNTPALNGALIRVNPVTGGQTVVAAGANLVNPTGLTIAPNGLVFIADRGPQTSPGGVFPSDGRVTRVDPNNGSQTIVTQGNLLQEPRGITISAKDGTLFVTDTADNQIVKVDPVSGQQSLLVGPPLANPQKMTLDLAGNVLVSDTGAVRLVNSTSGAVSTVASGAALSAAEGIARELSGSLVVANRSVNLARATGGTASLLSSGNLFRELTGVDVAQKCGTKFANPAFIGGPGKDNLVGTPTADVFVAGPGKDKIKGLGGKDFICGGPGKDKLNGGKGNDRILGQGGNDTCTGGPGKNKLKSC